MLKRITLLLLICLSVAGVYFTVRTLQQKTLENLPIINCIPKDAAIILDLENPIRTWSLLSATNIIWNDLKNINYFNTLDNELQRIDSIIQLDSILNGSKLNKQIIVSIHPSTEKPNLILAFSSTENVFKILKNHYGAKEDKSGLDKIGEKNPWYIYYHFPFTILSTNQELLKNSINQLQKKESLLADKEFVSIKKTVSKGSNVHVYTNTINLKKLAIPFVKKAVIENWKTNNNWTAYDLIFKNDEIILNGLSIATNKNQNVKFSSLIDANLLPPNLVSVNEFTIDKGNNPKILEQIDNDCNCNINQQLDDWVGNHLTEITFEKDLKAIFISTKTTDNVIEDLSKIVKIDTAKYEIFGTEVYRIFSSSFAQISGFPANEIYCYYHNSNLVFSSYKGLKQLMYFWRKTKNIEADSFYKSFSNKMMAQKSTASHFANLSYLTTKGLDILKPEHLKMFSNNVESLSNKIDLAYQTNALDNHFLHQAIILKSNPKNQIKSNELWEVALKNKIIFGPKLVKNHKSKSLDIFVQDTTNTLFLINASGNIKWSKKLEEPIMEKINQIDLFGNNKYQLVFNTATKIYLLDINGNTTSGFPIQLPSTATTPVSVFDYKQDNNYHFWISCRNNVSYNYTEEGKLEIDWKSPQSLDLMVASFKHFSIESQDYFYSLDKTGKLYLLNNKGKKARTIDTTLNPKNNQLYFQKRASLSSSSFIYVCDSTNKIKNYTIENNLTTYHLDSNNTSAHIVLLDLKQDSYLDYISFSQNRLEIYGPDKTLVNRNEYLFNVEESYAIIKDSKNKTYIVLQDLDTKELIILNENLTQLNRTSILGDPNAGIGDINANNKLNLVCRKDSQTIVAYKVE